jgi:hypothetical protein
VVPRVLCLTEDRTRAASSSAAAATAASLSFFFLSEFNSFSCIEILPFFPPEFLPPFYNSLFPRNRRFFSFFLFLKGGKIKDTIIAIMLVEVSSYTHFLVLNSRFFFYSLLDTFFLL